MEEHPTSIISIEERKLLLAEKEFEIKKSESEARIENEKKSSKFLTPITATILVALISFLGSSISAFFQASNTNKLELQKFQSTLIMKALEQPAFEDRAKFLKFLTTLNLINDKSLSNTIDSFLINQPQNIPYIAIPEISAASITDSSNLNKLREKEKVDKKIQDGDYEGAIKLDPANLIAYMRLIEKLVKDKDYSKAVTYFNSLVSSNKSGVGYSVYPDLIFAYDQIGNINQAGILIQQLRLRVNDDIKSGYGYYSHSQQIGWLKRDLEKDLNYFKNPSLKNSIGNFINELNGIILKLTT